MIYSNFAQAVDNGFLVMVADLTNSLPLLNRKAGDRKAIFSTPFGLNLTAYHTAGIGETAENYANIAEQIGSMLKGGNWSNSGYWSMEPIAPGTEITPKQLIDFRVVTGNLDTTLYKQAISQIGSVQAQTIAQQSAPVYSADYGAFQRAQMGSESAQTVAQQAVPVYGADYGAFQRAQVEQEKKSSVAPLMVAGIAGKLLGLY